MKDHTDLLNLIAKKIKAKSYLEIGVFNPDHNFNKINVKNKISVDPDPQAGAMFKITSDEFFASNNRLFDLIFIDGLHHAEQARKDLINAWNSLNEYGVIVMHDCNPPTKETTCVPRGTQREWCGDVFKVACELDKKFTVDFDYGCTIIRNDGDDNKIEKNKIKSWEYFESNRRELLNLVSKEDALEVINSW